MTRANPSSCSSRVTSAAFAVARLAKSVIPMPAARAATGSRSTGAIPAASAAGQKRLPGRPYPTPTSAEYGRRVDAADQQAHAGAHGIGQGVAPLDADDRRRPAAVRGAVQEPPARSGHQVDEAVVGQLRRHRHVDPGARRQVPVGPVEQEGEVLGGGGRGVEPPRCARAGTAAVSVSGAGGTGSGSGRARRSVPVRRCPARAGVVDSDR